MKKVISDERIIDLIIAYMNCTVVDDHLYYRREKGILQGGPVSPLFSNIYMNELDHYMEWKNYKFCRFGDDINIYCQSYEDAFEQLHDIEGRLTEKESLPLNNGKTGIYKALNRKYLGYRFEEKAGEIIVKKENKAYRTVYNWNSENRPELSFD